MLRISSSWLATSSHRPGPEGNRQLPALGHAVGEPPDVLVRRQAGCFGFLSSRPRRHRRSPCEGKSSRLPDHPLPLRSGFRIPTRTARDAGRPGLPGVDDHLRAKPDGHGIVSATRDQRPRRDVWSICGLPETQYTVAETVPPGYQQTAPVRHGPDQPLPGVDRLGGRQGIHGRSLLQQKSFCQPDVRQLPSARFDLGNEVQRRQRQRSPWGPERPAYGGSGHQPASPAAARPEARVDRHGRHPGSSRSPDLAAGSYSLDEDLPAGYRQTTPGGGGMTRRVARSRTVRHRCAVRKSARQRNRSPARSSRTSTRQRRARSGRKAVSPASLIVHCRNPPTSRRRRPPTPREFLVRQPSSGNLRCVGKSSRTVSTRRFPAPGHVDQRDARPPARPSRCSSATRRQRRDGHDHGAQIQRRPTATPVQDPGETGVAGVTINLFAAYCFRGRSRSRRPRQAPRRNVHVRQCEPGRLSGLPRSCRTDSCKPCPAGPGMVPVAVVAGETASRGVLIGNEATAAGTGTISGEIQRDANGNAAQDRAEAGVAGVTINLFAASRARSRRDDHDGRRRNVRVRQCETRATIRSPRSCRTDSCKPCPAGRAWFHVTVVAGRDRVGDPLRHRPGRRDRGRSRIHLLRPQQESIQDQGEKPLPRPSLVRLEDLSGNILSTAVTGANGIFTFTGVPAGGRLQGFPCPAPNFFQTFPPLHAPIPVHLEIGRHGLESYLRIELLGETMSSGIG